MRYCLVLFTLIFFVIFPKLLFAYCSDFEDNYYYTVSLHKGDNVCYSYYMPSGKMSIFTLKHKSGSADFDIAIYDYSSMSSILGKGDSSGTKSELVTLSPDSHGNTVYIKIKNYGKYKGKYELHIHQIDFVEKAGEVLVKTLIKSGVNLFLEAIFDVNENSHEEAKRNISRGSTLIMSALKGSKLGETSLDLLINEITEEIRKEFGYGFTGKLVVNYAVNIIKDVYRYY